MVLSILCIIDGSLQIWHIESDLFRRITTDFFLGISIVLSICYTTNLLVEKGLIGS